MFDARGITGDTGAFQTVETSFSLINTLTIVLDGIAGEVYGLLDDGTTVTETAHFAVSSAQLASIDAIYASTDFRSAIAGGTPPVVTTTFGQFYVGSQYDNLQLSDDSVAVSSPGTFLIFGFLALFLLRRRAHA